MPRRSGVPKREVNPDPVYNSEVITKLINQIMWSGERSVAQKIVYEAFEIIEKKLNLAPDEVFNKALENLMPVVEVKARRVGGANYQVPIEVRPDRRQTLGLRWLVSFSRKRSERTMKERLAEEIIAAYNGSGSAFKKKEEIHRMADANKAFAHFRW